MDRITHRPEMPRRSVPKKANPDMVREIRQRRAEGASLKQIATEFGISEPGISRIVRRLSWRHVA